MSSSSYPHKAVSTDGDQLTLVHDELLYCPLVAGFLALSADLHLDEPSVPQEHVAPLRPREHFAVGQLHVAPDVGDLGPAKLAQLPLQLEAGEGSSHLPKPERRRE